MNYYIVATETRSGGGSTSDEPWSRREDAEIDWVPRFLVNNAMGGNAELLECMVPDNISDLAHAYLISVRYSNGDTFGQTRGYHHTVAVTATAAEANEIKRGIENKTWKMPSGYIPWDGYFASFEGVQIDFVPVGR